MPPKKKRCPPPPSKPGIGKKHLQDNYSHQPDSGDFLNGHVLFLYLCRCNSSRTKTVEQLLTYLPGSSANANDKGRKTFLDSGIKRIVSATLEKFHQLTNQGQFNRFADICKQHFAVQPVEDTPSLPSASIEHEVLPKSPKKISKSPLKTRQTTKCTNCRRLRNDISALSSRHLLLQRDKMIAIRTLRLKQKNTKSVKHLNQCLKTKNEQIKRNKEKIEQGVSAEKNVISKLRKKHSQLKQYHQKKMKTSKLTLFDKEDQRIISLEEKVKKQEDEIIELQKDKQLLTEKVKEMESTSKVSKSDAKTCNNDIRMMILDAIESQVPTNNIPLLVKKFCARNGITMTDIPHRSTVEKMVRELGTVAELQTAEVRQGSKDTILGFDATVLPSRGHT